jgi:multiple sugar transport system substrate-binding protein
MTPREDGADLRLTRRRLVQSAVGIGAAFTAGPLLAACGGDEKKTAATTGGKAGGKIVIGSVQDNALRPLRDTFFDRFTTETGIQVQYNETNYDTWYQNAKNDGLNKSGNYDVYIMDDNWVPEFAAAGIIVDLEEAGLKVNPDILEKGLNQGYWPPKEGPRLKDFADDEPKLYALVIDDDVEILYYNNEHFAQAPKTWDEIFEAMKAKAKPPTLYGWSARGVKGNPIMMTYLPLLNSYNGNFVNDDWTPGFAGPEGVGALERLFSFIPYMPRGVAEFDTDQETQVLLEGKSMALTEYTGLSQRIDDPGSSKVVGKINTAATPAQEKSGPAIGTFIAGVPPSAPNQAGAIQFLDWFTSEKVQIDFARDGGSAAVTGKALTDQQANDKYRWLSSIADAVNNSVPKPRTPDEPKFEDILGTELNKALVEAISQKSNFTQIAQKHLTAAANEMTAYMKQQGGYF